MNKIRKFLRTPISWVISFIFSVGSVIVIYNLRVGENPISYKYLNYGCLFLLLLSILDVFLAYKDKNSTAKEMMLEAIPSVFFFIAFFVTKMLLRG